MHGYDDDDMSPEAVAARKAWWGNGPAISASALPTRDTGASAEMARTKRWEKEHDAARQLKRSGVKQLPRLADAPAVLAQLGG